jgi:hypothetical protein
MFAGTFLRLASSALNNQATWERRVEEIEWKLWDLVRRVGSGDGLVEL